MRLLSVNGSLFVIKRIYLSLSLNTFNDENLSLLIFPHFTHPPERTNAPPPAAVPFAASGPWQCLPLRPPSSTAAARS